MRKEKNKSKNKKSTKTTKVVNATPHTAYKSSPQLTPEEQKAIRQKIKELKRRNLENNRSVQSVIPFIGMLPDGTCKLENGRYSQTVEFFNCNYRLLDEAKKNEKFEAWCKVLNFFDSTVQFQITYEKQYVDNRSVLKKLEIPPVSDSFNDVRLEYSDILMNQYKKSNSGTSCIKYLTYSIEAKNYGEASSKLRSIGNDIIKLFAEFNVHAVRLDGYARLNSLYHSLNPFSNDTFVFDWQAKKKSGMSTKDFIVPPSMKFKKDCFEIGNAYGRTTTIVLLASELPDNFITELLKPENGMLSINIHVNAYDQQKALKLLRSKLTDLEARKIDEQKKASRNGFDYDILSPLLKDNIENARKMLDGLSENNEKLFMVTLVLRNYAKTKEALETEFESLKRTCETVGGSKLLTLDYVQEQALGSSLPLGINKNKDIVRDLPTNALGAFISFETFEAFDIDNGCYYGMNAITKQMILINRKKLKNPNALILGVPGAGKSFSAKREILDRYLRSGCIIIILDPENEYSDLVRHLNGQVITISADSNDSLNPMDVTLDDTDIKTVISTKSNFLISLCEIIVGQSLTSDERSVIDKATKSLYTKFFENEPTAENMPTLVDFQNELRTPVCRRRSTRLVNSLDMYISGTQNIFNCKSNVDINNRIVCFNTRNLGNALKKVAMLVVQDQVWNKVSQNRDKNIETRYYIDEFHLLLQDEQTANYSVEMWKRFRKWNAIPTGITQNVKDLLRSLEIENILDNSDFIYLLSQESGDADILAEKLKLSEASMKFVKNVPPGCGLIKSGDLLLPFEDYYPEDTVSFELLNTNPDKKKKKELKNGEDKNVITDEQSTA